MEPAQIMLIVTGLAVAAGGVLMLVRSAATDRRAEARGQSVRPRPLIPLGVIAVGIIIAYHAYSDWATIQPSDVSILFLFIFVLATLLGLRFFIVDKLDGDAAMRPDDGPPRNDDRSSE